MGSSDMFVEAHVEKTMPPVVSEEEKSDKNNTNYTVENKHTSSNMYAKLQDISDNEMSDRGQKENDELLGNALAEMEAEDKEEEKLKKKLGKVKGAMDKVKKKKKKKDKKKEKKKSKLKDKDK